LATEPPSSAFYDLYYLLSRGYPRQQALSLIRAKYALSREDLILLSRCVHPPSINKEIARKKQAVERVRGACLVIDGFNQLTTIYAALIGKPLYICTDTMLRDSLLAGPRLVVENIEKLAPILAKALQNLSPSSTTIILDSQPSHSGETAAYLRRTLRVEARTSNQADKEVIEETQRNKCIAATSDIAITLKVQRIFDLAHYTITRIVGPERINNIPHLLRREHQWWCSEAPEAGP